MLERDIEPDHVLGLTQPNSKSYSLPDWIQITIWTLVLCLALVLSLRSYTTFQVGTTEDDAQYAVLARSLVFSDRYGLMNSPGEPGLTRYPFGYPLLLSPLVILFPESPDPLKLLSLVATALNAILLFWGWRWFSPSTSYWWGLAVTGLYLLSPRTINQSRTVMSDPIFTTFCLASILLAQRAREKQPGILECVALGFTLLFTVFTRTAGVALVAAILVSWSSRWGKTAWRPLAIIGVSSLVLLGLIVAATPVGAGDLLPFEYSQQFTSPSSWGQNPNEDSLAYRLAMGANEYLTQHIRYIFIPLGGGETEQAMFNRIGLPFVPLLFGWIISGIVALGYVRWFNKEGLSIPALFSLLYLGIMIVWPWRGPRFLHPIQPQLYLALLLGSGLILEKLVSLLKLKSFVTPLVLGAICLVLMGLYTYINFPKVDTRLHTGDLRARSAWVRSHTGASDVIMTEQPQIDYLYGSRKTVPFERFASPEELEAYLKSHQVTHILIAPQLIWQARYKPRLSPTSQDLLLIVDSLAAQGQLELEYESEGEGINVYKVKHPSSTPAKLTEITVYFTDSNRYTIGTPPFEAPVTRLAPSPANLPEAVLKAFFEGPTAEEQEEGLELITSGFTRFRALIVQDGVARVYMSGSCSSGGATYTVAQPVLRNMLQFPEIRSVKIYDSTGQTEEPWRPGNSIPMCLEP